ncbi:MAG: bifunctional folylpolyglutamate synthase/dihydrofolate synthase, partial [Candidatus Zixiibacteriota bacterium]
PNLTITTDIDFDHTEILGETIQKISREKAGIIKSGTPHLIGQLPTAAADIMSKTCQELSAPFHKLNRTELKPNKKKMSLTFANNGFSFAEISPALYGLHQLSNTALVLKATAIFRSNGLYVSKKAIKEGIRNTVWPGRFQILTAPGKPAIVLDVAHNPGGIRAFVEAFRLRFSEKKGLFISGFVQKKNHQGIFDKLSEIAAEYVLVPLRTKRSADAQKLLRKIDFRGVPARRCGTLAGAFQYVTKKADSDDIICVVGSHYLVGEFLEKFGAKWAERPDKTKIPSQCQSPAKGLPKLRPTY